MNSKVILLFVVLLSSCCSLFAQQQLSYYYHKGEQIVLPINLQHFLVYADVNKISDELFEEEYRVTEWIENGSNGIIEAQVTIPNGNYDSVVNVLKAKDYIVDVEPVIGNNMLINTSRLFYVKLHKSQDYPLLSYMASRTGADIRGKVDYCENWYELCVNKYSAGNSIEATNQFWETGFFEGVDPGFIFHFESASVTTCVSDPRFNEQWGLQAIKACSAWKITTGDTNVRIAVIDKGIDESHREFDSTCVCFSFDMDNCFSHALVYCEIDHERGPDQPHQDSTICVYHGINVGGVIFSNHNRDSIAGVCPKAGLINISHSFKLREDSIASKAARAIIMSVSNGARVINNSWMIKDTISQIASELLEDAIDYALIHNCVVVFAAGNGNNGVSNGCVSYPARCNSQILTVGAVDISLEKTSCSNYGFGLDVVAPGSGILSTHNDNGYNISQGTSMATPHVAGVAGLMFSINPALTGQNVRDIIEQTAYKIPDQLYDTVTENGTWAEYVGYGLLDAHRAVLKAAYHKVYGDTVLTLCDTSTHVYTVRAPHNANIDSVSFFWTCSDNLQMVTGQNTDSVLVKPYNGGIGQLQCHIIHNGDTVVSTMSVSVVSNRTIYDNISLNNNISYPDTFILSRKIVIDSLAGLTWQNKTVLCTPDCKITIRPGGLMTINHTTLTSACLGKMWQGIEVVGNPDKRQIPQWQGVVELKNGATIKNAHCAIRTGLHGDSVYFTTGGIIQADSAFFINNRRSVEFMSYTNHSPAGNVMNNQSYFYRCVFTVDDDNLFGQDNGSFIDHVTIRLDCKSRLPNLFSKGDDGCAGLSVCSQENI